MNHPQEVTNTLIEDASGFQGVITALDSGSEEDIEYTFHPSGWPDHHHRRILVPLGENQ